MRTTLIVLAAALLLTACGGGGGSSSAPPTAEGQEVALGERAAPGCLISVSRAPGAVAASCRLRILVRTEAGSPAPVALEVWAATGPEAPPATVTARAEGGDAWSATLPLPSPLPVDLAVWCAT